MKAKKYNVYINAMMKFLIKLETNHAIFSTSQQVVHCQSREMSTLYTILHEKKSMHIRK
jgi:hypothetical protein